MRASFSINDALSYAGILFLLSSHKISVMDPLVHGLVISETCSSGYGLKEVFPCFIEREYLLSVEAEIYPGTKYSSRIVRESSQIGNHLLFPALAFALFSVSRAVPGTRIVDQHAFMLYPDGLFKIEIVVLETPHDY